MKDELKIAALGVVGIVFLESFALFKGVDGTMFGTAMAGVGSIVGYVIKAIVPTKSKRKK